MRRLPPPYWWTQEQRVGVGRDRVGEQRSVQRRLRASSGRKHRAEWVPGRVSFGCTVLDRVPSIGFGWAAPDTADTVGRSDFRNTRFGKDYDKELAG